MTEFDLQDGAGAPLRERMGLADIPMDWFCGFGRKENGITIVTYGDLVKNFGDGEVGRHMGWWTHFTGNPSGRWAFRRRRLAAAAINAANNYVTGALGFSPREIMDKAHQLQDEYHGKDSAPFPFELY